MPCDEPDFQEQEKEARQMAQMLSTPSSLPCVSPPATDANRLLAGLSSPSEVGAVLAKPGAGPMGIGPSGGSHATGGSCQGRSQA